SDTVYQKYDNYDAIEVPFTNAIPSDYDGVMGVPISFLDKYSSEQFEIISSNDIRANNNIPYKEHGLIKDKDGTIMGKPVYVRIIIKHKKTPKSEEA
ncbi:MAG: modification methylase, partial [Spirochaeta sp. LUC14_002_19_P3]